MTTIGTWYDRYLKAHNVSGLEIPFTAVKFYQHVETISQQLRVMEPTGLTLTSCQATKQASLGDAVCLRRKDFQTPTANYRQRSRSLFI